MRRIIRTAAVAAATLCAASAAVFLPAIAAHAGPADIVPRGDLAYDLLGSLAARGHLPGLTLRDLFRGDRLYTRAEMADMVRRVLEQYSTPTDEDCAAIRALVWEFTPELGTAVRLPLAPTGRLTVDVKARLLSGPDAAGGIGRASYTQPLGSSAYAAVSLGNGRDEWYDRRSEPYVRQHGYPFVETAFVRANGRFLDLLAGLQPLRWGPGYGGGLLFSDQPAAIPQIKAEKTFRMGGWFRRLGPLHFEQLDGQFFEDNIPAALPDAQGTRRYLLGRRIETAGRGPWSLSLGEALKSTRLPDPVAANLLPFYLYQNEWTKSGRHHLFGTPSGALDDTYWKNYLADLNTSYRADGRGTTLYGDLLLDDLKAPRGLGMNGPTARKLGVQAGVYAPDLGGLKRRVGGRLEYATIDPGTYTNVSLPVTWTAQGIPLGYPAGPNANVVFGRLDFAATPRVKLAIEGATRRRKGDDFANTPFPAPNTDRVGLYATYSLQRNAFVGARFEHFHSENGAATAPKSSDRAEINVGAGF